MFNLITLTKNYFQKYTNVFEHDKKYSVVDFKEVLWNDKPIKKNSLIIWDLENISFHRLEDIKRLSRYTPEKLYVITKQKLSLKLRVKIEKEQFKILDLHDTISDDKIIKVMKLYNLYTHMLLITSDSDFVNPAQDFLKEKYLHWIIEDHKKKPIIMKMNLANTRLTFSTFTTKKVLSKATQKANKPKKVISYSDMNNKQRLKYNRIFSQDSNKYARLLSIASPLEKMILNAYSDFKKGISDSEYRLSSDNELESYAFLQFLYFVSVVEEKILMLNFLKAYTFHIPRVSITTKRKKYYFTKIEQFESNTK
jgi:hypothetical protein